jgi:hypothetical protein
MGAKGLTEQGDVLLHALFTVPENPVAFLIL